MSALSQHYIDTGHRGGIEIVHPSGITWVECPQCDQPVEVRKDGPMKDATFLGLCALAFIGVCLAIWILGIDLSEPPPSAR